MLAALSYTRIVLIFNRQGFHLKQGILSLILAYMPESIKIIIITVIVIMTVIFIITSIIATTIFASTIVIPGTFLLTQLFTL